MLRRHCSPLLLASAAGSALAATYAVSPAGDGRGVPSALHGSVARSSSRAIYTIGFVVVDYRYSLRGLALGSADYRVKLSEVHLRSAKKLLKLTEGFM